MQHLEWFRPLHELLVLALAAIYHKLSMKSLHVDGGDGRRHSVTHAQHDMMDVFDGADKHQTCWKLTTARRPRVSPGKRPCMSKLASTPLPGTCTVILWSSFVFFKCEMSMYATRIAFSSGFDDGVAAAAGSRGGVVDARVIFYVEQHARYAGHTQTWNSNSSRPSPITSLVYCMVVYSSSAGAHRPGFY